MLKKMYTFRLYPTNKQTEKLEWTLARCCELYNAALQERWESYKYTGKGTNYNQQAMQLPEIKELREEYKDIHFLLTSMYVGDAIAGERERHTLEALLASRISDWAILLGKIMVMVGTAWGMALASLLLGMLSANLASGQGRWAFYGSFGPLLEALALSLLTSLLVTSAGVLISLRAATVRQAQQTLALFTVLLGALLLATRAVPARGLLAPATSASQLWLLIIAALAVLDALVSGATFVRFRRSRLLFH